MILSRGRSYLFIHIPKTGGTSLALALETRAMKDDIMLGDTPKATKRRRQLQGFKASGRLWKHSRLADLEGLLTPGEVEGLFVFTLVRNPWDKLVSYYHWLREQRFKHPHVQLSKLLDFRDFALHPSVLRAARASTSQSYMTTTDGHEMCSAYIRIECFNEDAQPLFDHLGFNLVLNNENVSARNRDYRTYFDDVTAKAVAIANAGDIVRFGYSFDPV